MVRSRSYCETGHPGMLSGLGSFILIIQCLRATLYSCTAPDISLARSPAAPGFTRFSLGREETLHVSHFLVPENHLLFRPIRSRLSSPAALTQGRRCSAPL